MTTPQPTQQDLAAFIDAEGLDYQWRHKAQATWSSEGDGDKAVTTVSYGFEIRIAPGALTEFGLKPGMEPRNPDNLPAKQITEGGKYRAVVADDSCAHPHEFWVSLKQVWIKGGQAECSFKEVLIWDNTCRVPATTPFPKPEPTRPESQAQESETPQTDAFVEYMEYQFPGTVGHRPMRDKVAELERELNAARECVNACQGIADPAKAILAAKEALAYSIICLHGHRAYKSTLELVRDALTQLNGRAGE